MAFGSVLSQVYDCWMEIRRSDIVGFEHEHLEHGEQPGLEWSELRFEGNAFGRRCTNCASEQSW
jgi:hypothetical protein